MKKIGLRTIKTGIAVFLATLAGYLGIVETPVYTVSVCIFSIKNTVKNSLDDARSRILGTLLGGIVGYLFAVFTNCNIIFVSLGVIIVIHLCHSFKFSDSAGVASVTFAAISIGVGQQRPLTYSIMRTLDTLVGVLISLIVNYSVNRPRYMKYLWSSFNLSHDQIICIIKKMVSNNDFSSSYNKLQEKYTDLESFYNLLIDELSYSNDSKHLTTLYKDFDICEQLLHHIHGLYLLEKKSSLNSTKINDDICKYHKKNINSLLEGNLDEI